MIGSDKRRLWMGGAAMMAVAGMATALLADRASNAAEPIGADRAAIEKIVHDYILEHPEIIPQAIERLRDNLGAKTYSEHRAKLETPFAGAWAGAEDGDVTLVMFTDYACGYCRSSVPDVDRLLSEDKKLKVIWRELPILGPDSEVAARASLAAARQGAYREFHTRMFAAGRPDAAKVQRILAGLNIDQARARQDSNSGAVAQEIDSNIAVVQKFDSGVATPTFFVNGQMLKGAVGYEALRDGIAAARKKSA